MNFPIIHTNFWDALIAVPVIIILTQLIKVFFKIPRKFVPLTAQVFGLIISVFIISVYVTFKYSIFERFKKLNMEIDEIEQLEKE